MAASRVTGMLGRMSDYLKGVGTDSRARVLLGVDHPQRMADESITMSNI